MTTRRTRHEQGKADQALQRGGTHQPLDRGVCFLLLAISGLAFFYPAFFWLTGVFGTPQLARIVHPFVGC
jgi:formate dehydrogenase subunit gamma